MHTECTLISSEPHVRRHVTNTRSEYDLIDAETKLYSSPPEELVACVAWEGEGPDEVVVLHVWKTPEARGEFAFKKIMPLAQAGKVASSPKRLKPVKVFLRSDPT